MDALINTIPLNIQIAVLWIFTGVISVVVVIGTGYFMWVWFKLTQRMVRRIEAADRRDYFETFGREKPTKKRNPFGRICLPKKPVGMPLPKPRKSDIHRESGRPGRPGVHPAPPVPDRPTNNSPDNKGDEDGKQDG